jgi:uncharacterized membrane protein
MKRVSGNMNKIVAILFSLLLLLSVFPGALADVGATPTDATTQRQPSSVKLEQLVQSAPGASATKNILWDTTHGVYLNYEPSGRYKGLVTLLNGKGYTVTTINNGILNNNLNQYGILVVNLGSAWNSQYTAAEVQAIKNFVQNGGGLLIMGDNTGTPNGNINPVSQAFGTTVGVSQLATDDYITDFASHVLFNGVQTFYYRAGGEINSIAPSSNEIAWDSANKGVLSVKGGNGKVVITGDINFAEDDYRGQYNNQRLTENIFDWLVPMPSTIVSIDDAVAGTGGSVTVPIKINNVNNLAAADIWLSYNKNVVIVESVSNGNLGSVTSGIDNVNGITKMNWFSVTGKSGNFVFAYVTLKAVGTPGQTSSLHLTVKELVDPNGKVILSTTRDGLFKVASLMEGDVNLNKCVSITDALYIAQYLAGLRSLTPEQLKAADTNDEGSVTITDALYIARWLANPVFPLWDPVKDFDMLKPMAC